MDHPAMVDQAAANVLSNSQILMSSPSAAKLNSFYPSPSESTSTIAQSVNNSGQLRIQANSKQIGGSSDFLISTPNILDIPMLNLSFEVGAIPDPAIAFQFDQRKRIYMCTYHDGWGFDCIDRIECTFAKSNISNLQLQGHALRDWSLLQCKNEDERKQMLKIAGRGQTWTVDQPKTLHASIPLSFLFFRSAGGVKGGFPIDGRALHGPITFQIHFKPIQYFCGPAASAYVRSALPDSLDAGVADIGDGTQIGDVRGAVFPSSINPATLLPTQFSTLEFTARTYQLMDGIFSVSKALEANPSLTYSLPSLWLNTYSQEVQINNAGFGQLNINSIPAGMLQAIIIRVRPVNPTSYQSYNFATAGVLAADATFQGDYQSKLNYDPPNYNNVTRPVSQGDPATFNRLQTGVTRAFRPYVPWSLPISSVRLEYSGQAIYSASSEENHDNFIRSVFCDDLKTKVCGLPLTQTVLGQKSFAAAGYNPLNSYGVGNGTFTLTENLGDRAMIEHDTKVMVIPLCHDGNGVFRNRDFENLPHYSGSTLQLQFTVAPYNTYSSSGLDRQLCYDTGAQLGNDPDLPEDVSSIDGFGDIVRWKPELDGNSCTKFPSNRLQHVAASKGPNDRIANGTISVPPAAATNPQTVNSQERERVIFNNNPNSGGAAAFDGNGGVVQLDLTYVMSSLFQVTNGTAELQL